MLFYTDYTSRKDFSLFCFFSTSHYCSNFEFSVLLNNIWSWVNFILCVQSEGFLQRVVRNVVFMRFIQLICSRLLGFYVVLLFFSWNVFTQLSVLVFVPHKFKRPNGLFQVGRSRPEVSEFRFFSLGMYNFRNIRPMFNHGCWRGSCPTYCVIANTSSKMLKQDTTVR